MSAVSALNDRKRNLYKLETMALCRSSQAMRGLIIPSDTDESGRIGSHVLEDNMLRYRQEFLFHQECEGTHDAEWLNKISIYLEIIPDKQILYIASMNAQSSPQPARHSITPLFSGFCWACPPSFAAPAGSCPCTPLKVLLYHPLNAPPVCVSP